MSQFSRSSLSGRERFSKMITPTVIRSKVNGEKNKEKDEEFSENKSLPRNTHFQDLNQKIESMLDECTEIIMQFSKNVATRDQITIEQIETRDQITAAQIATRDKIASEQIATWEEIENSLMKITKVINRKIDSTVNELKGEFSQPHKKHE